MVHNMTKLPSRPREHELETESRRAFESVLPGAWEDGSPPADYGVDKYVEVFEGSGSGSAPTGLIFAAQLKGTDSTEVTALRIGIPWRTVNYWTALPVPVLLVLYVAPTDRLFATWAHQHYRAFVNDQRQRAWFVLNAARDVLTRDNVTRLADEVRQFNAARHRDFAWPLEVAVADDLHNASLQLDLLRKCSRLQVGMAKRLDLRPADAPREAPILTIAADLLAFDLGAGFGASVATKGQTEEILKRPTGAADVLMLAASGLSSLGIDEVATELLARVLPEASLLDGSSCIGVGQSALRAGHRDLVQELIVRVAATEPVVALTLANALVPPSPFVQRPEDLDTIEHALRRALTQTVEDGVPTFWRGLGRWLARVYRTDEACEAFATAAALEPSLESDPRFCYHRGVAMFESGDRQGAMDQYSRALELGEDDPACRALYADTLLWDGEFARANQEFEVAAKSQLQFAGLGQLVSGFVQKIWGASHTRDPELARTRFRKIEQSERLPDLDSIVSVLSMKGDRLSRVD